MLLLESSLYTVCLPDHWKLDALRLLQMKLLTYDPINFQFNYMHMCVSDYVCARMHTFVCIFMYVCVFVYVCVYVHVFVYMC